MMHEKLKKPRTYGPEVRLVRGSDCAVVEKSYRDRILPVRMLGYLLVFWERFIYRKLQGIEGIPVLMPCPDPLTLVTRFMGGKNLRDTETLPDKEYFEALTALISQMHSRGVIHLDLRNRRNYGIDEAGRPYLVDFATCLYIPWKNRISKTLEALDWMGFLKVKHKIRPDLIDEGERHMLDLGNRLSDLWLPMKAVRALRSFSRFLKRDS